MQAMFSREKVARWFFVGAALVVLALFLRILWPFLLVLVSAAILTVLTAPVEQWLRRYIQRPYLRAGIITLLVILLLAIPLAIGSIILAQQVLGLVSYMSAQPQGWSLEQFSWFSLLPLPARTALQEVDLSSVVQWIAGSASDVFKSGADLLFKTVLFFICFYYLLLDRDKIADAFFSFSPLHDSLEHDIVRRITQTVRGVVFGSLVVALIQGIVAGIGMTIFGVPGALLWASCVVVTAQVPMVGTAAVTVPAIAYLFLSGNIAGGIGLLLWSMLAVGLVDNILQPIIVGSRTRMHALLILLSMLGGLQAFGPIGFILGPTILAAFLVVIEIFQALMQKGKKLEQLKPGKVKM